MGSFALGTPVLTPQLLRMPQVRACPGQRLTGRLQELRRWKTKIRLDIKAGVRWPASCDDSCLYTAETPYLRNFLRDLN